MKIKEYLKENESGFTLVELLVVIVIIGILAVGVLAAINPIEQIRRGRDTARQSSAREFMTACERYYGIKEEYPWDTASASVPSGTQLTSSAWSNYGANLVTENELRAGFSNRSPITNGELYITEDSDENVHVCFLPESDAFQDKADCSSAAPAGDGTICDGTVAADEYFCVPDSTQ